MGLPTEESSLDDVLELLAAQAVSCGLLKTSKTDETRENFIASCRDLATLVQQRQDSEEYHQRYDDETWLLEMEESAANLREKSTIFLEHQRTILSEIGAFSAEMESIGKHDKDCQKTILHGRSLESAFRKKCFFEKLAIESVLDKLRDLLYDNTTSSGGVSLATVLLNTATLLSKQTLNKSPQWQSITSLIHLWRKEHENDSKNQTENQTKLKTPPAKQIPLKSHDDISDSDTLSEDAPKLENREIPVSLKHLSSTLHRFRNALGFHKVLLVGSEGSGKTHICDQIASHFGERRNTQVLRFSSTGRTVGEAEDSIVSFFFHGMDDDKEHSILLLDDIDKCVTGLMVDTGMPRVNGVLQSEQRQRHAESRALSTFLGALDSLMDTRLRPRVNIILVCTCTTNINTSLLRFDDVVNLEPPPFEERSKIVAGFIGLSNGSATIPKDEKSLVDDIAASTVGMSYAEISQCCRLAIAEVENESDDTADEQQRSNESLSYSKALRLMQDTLHSMTPASLRSGENDGFVDMRVLSSKDLQAECPGSSKECPLFGSSVETAWRELESLVVFPLCRADALNQLLANIKQPSTSVKLCGGVLLTGGPGSGKSSLARYCAAYAASILPSVKLLEVSCTSLIQKEVGSSERAIRRLFDCARSAAPCIVILDDVAIVSSVRGNDNTTEGTMDRVLSTLLTELDGIDRQASAGIEWAGFAVIGITQNEEWVDPALLRPGRLGKTVRLGSPDKETRRRIAIKELKKNQIANDRATETDIASEVASLAEAIAERTDGLNSASVIAMCNEAKRSIITKYSDSAKLPDPSDILHMMHNHVLALPFRSSNTQ